MKNFLKTILISQLFVIPLLADIGYEVMVVQTKTGNFWDMDIEIRSTGTTPFVLSTSSFFLDFPTSPIRFSNPEKINTNDGPWDFQTDADYNDILLSSDEGFLGLTVEFTGGDDNNGLVVPNTWTRIGTLRLTIIDTTLESGLTWRLTGSVTQLAVLTEPGVVNGGSTSVTSLGTFVFPGNFILPVELSLFSAMVKGESVELKWQTQTEVNNGGFEIERKSGSQNGSNKWEKIGFVKGNGNSNSIKKYNFSDNPLGGSRFIYRLKQTDNNGTFKYSKEVEVELVPDKFELFQNYPNPFNPVTNIKFSLPVKDKIRLDVYNIIGEHIITLIDEEMEPGFHIVPFDAFNLASGIYIYRISSDKILQSKKMLLTK